MRKFNWILCLMGIVFIWGPMFIPNGTTMFGSKEITPDVKILFILFGAVFSLFARCNDLQWKSEDLEKRIEKLENKKDYRDYCGSGVLR